jgi:hypothetical protein
LAKVKMICPFSGKYCKECSLYRGRHYLLCFNNNYRGYLKESARGASKDTDNTRDKVNDIFKLSELEDSKSLDPFVNTLPDIE